VNASGRYIVSESSPTFPNELAKFLKTEFPNAPIKVDQSIRAPAQRLDLFDCTKAQGLGVKMTETARSVVAMAKSMERLDILPLQSA
jgi:hypothetical protein